MKKLAVFLCLTALASGAFAQGLINFANGPTTLISVNGAVMPSGAANTFGFALVAGASGATDYFTGFSQVTGIYGTNQAAAGRFTGGVGLTMGNWAPGDTKAFFVVGWSLAGNGSTFNPAWIQPGSVTTAYGSFRGTPEGFFGVSMIAPAGVGGGGPTGIPNLIPFGASQISAGFNLVPVPEPATLAFAGLGAAALLIFRRRK